MQQAIVSVVVAACAVYAVWALMPASARNWVRKVVLRRPPLEVGCGACGGCDLPVRSARATGMEPATAVRHRTPAQARRPPAATDGSRRAPRSRPPRD